MEKLDLYIENTAEVLEAIGVITLVLGMFIAFVQYGFSLRKGKAKPYTLLRHELGKAILLGLEILVAADIIATVVTEPTMDRVLTLGLIVLIRTFLSLSLQLEIDGKFPWQKKVE